MIKINMVTALFRLSMLCEKRGDTLIEDHYCKVSTIDELIGAISDPRNKIVDVERDYIVGVGGIYLSDPEAPGGSVPVYRVLT